MQLITFPLHETFQQMRHYLKKKHVGSTARWRQAGMEALQWKTVARRHTFFKFSFPVVALDAWKAADRTRCSWSLYLQPLLTDPHFFFVAAFPPFICNSTLFSVRTITHSFQVFFSLFFPHTVPNFSLLKTPCALSLFVFPWQMTVAGVCVCSAGSERTPLCH